MQKRKAGGKIKERDEDKQKALLNMHRNEYENVNISVLSSYENII